MRVTKGDIAIECADQAELAIALAVLSGTQADVPPLPGVHIPGVQFGPFKAELFNPQVPPLDCAMGLAELGEYITEDDEQRLRLVPDPYRFGTGDECGPAGDPRTDTVIDYGNAPVVTAGGHIEYPRPQLNVESPAMQHVPVSRKCLDVLEAVLLFPEGVYARGIGELLGFAVSTASGRLEMLKKRGLVEHPADNRKKWRATPLARRSKLVAC